MSPTTNLTSATEDVSLTDSILSFSSLHIDALVTDLSSDITHDSWGIHNTPAWTRQQRARGYRPEIRARKRYAGEACYGGQCEFERKKLWESEVAMVTSRFESTRSSYTCGNQTKAPVSKAEGEWEPSPFNTIDVVGLGRFPLRVTPGAKAEDFDLPRVWSHDPP